MRSSSRSTPRQLSAINFRGIKESVGINLVLTAIELTGLLLVVVIGAAFLFDGGGDPGRALDFKQGSSVPLAVLGGASLAFFALIGFEDSVNVAEETKEPSRVYPRALFYGLAIAGVVYMLVTVIASMAVETSKLVDSDGPLLEVVGLGPLGVSTKLFAAIALFALTNGALINLIMASRIVYGMSNEGIVPRAFGRVHEGRRTPWVAILFTAALAAVLVTVGDLESLADTTVLLLLIVLRVRQRRGARAAQRPCRARALPRPSRHSADRRGGVRRADRAEGRHRVADPSSTPAG
jgi:basic amino acid/polyamine antiporter, APA family